VARIPAPGDPERWIWLGVALLDGQPRRLVTERVRATGPELSVPVLGSSQAIALAAGPTRLRVVRDLAAAVDIRDGVVDPVSGERMPWVPAALPPTPRAASLPSATLRPAPAGGFDLELAYADTPRLLFDPDLVRLDGEALTGASELRWSSRDGAASSLAWPAASGLTDACHPYDQLDPAAPGSLVIHFAAPGPVDGRDLEGVLEDGRTVTLPVTVLAPAIATARAPEQGPDPGDERLELSPGLLTNSPNPFRNSTRVSFRVPTTAGEAFAWEGEDEPPFDPRQRLPFAGGVAGVTVTVYDLEGRVIARLADGNFGQGEYQASWDGTDQLGRTVASGAYFCKLQIEKWSVTKRLVFIR
jgi:hypothetical protein